MVDQNGGGSIGLKIFDGPHVSIVTLVEILDIVDDDDDDDEDGEELPVYMYTTCNKVTLSDINKMADLSNRLIGTNFFLRKIYRKEKLIGAKESPFYFILFIFSLSRLSTKIEISLEQHTKIKHKCPPVVSCPVNREYCF